MLSGSATATAAVAGCNRPSDSSAVSPAGPERDSPVSASAVADAPADVSELRSRIETVAEETPPGAFGIVPGRNDRVYEVAEPIVLPSNVHLHNFKFRLADGANADVIRSANFDALDGSNAWYVDPTSETARDVTSWTDGARTPGPGESRSDLPGVNHNFGLVNVHIDGNKANNDSGRGIAVYGKKYYVDNVFVHDCPGTGFYSACGAVGGQEDWPDLPAMQIDRLYARNNGGHGIVYRGPHDGQANMLIALKNGKRGFLCEHVDGAYSGNGFIVSKLHTTVNGKPQLFDAAGVQVFWNYVDVEPGSVIRTACVMHAVWNSAGWNGSSPMTIEEGATGTVIGWLELQGLKRDGEIKNDETGLTIEANGVHVQRAKVAKYGKHGIDVRANNAYIDNAAVSQNGGVGLNLHGPPDREGAFANQITVNSANKCGEAGVRYRQGAKNVLLVNTYVGSDSVGYDTDAGMPGPTDRFSLLINQADTGFALSNDRGRATFEGDGSRRRFTVSHRLIAPPTMASATAVNEDAPAVVRTTNYTADTFDVTFAEAPAAGTSPRVGYEATISEG
jgi:hypothetical protein